ncbi:uncharacterized protein BDR25DRAFT_350112 [Lindgomyces ingoldianus]|uniref:Uncharacterized protein n=1 Tax=Lindgomyces ingoldianus TaxID=673940 RepID=A0ACB6R982_9PLEO|nr:uncharacterized protein BDR25DRAFT_350112 [Lindgomyces ingoldianus]KAF2475829.1 hypothetical protein BDR25DRAFT_350112 [Lindgomyces ingoldianus]
MHKFMSITVFVKSSPEPLGGKPFQKKMGVSIMEYCNLRTKPRGSNRQHQLPLRLTARGNHSRTNLSRQCPIQKNGSLFSKYEILMSPELADSESSACSYTSINSRADPTLSILSSISRHNTKFRILENYISRIVKGTKSRMVPSWPSSRECWEFIGMVKYMAMRIGQGDEHSSIQVASSSKALPYQVLVTCSCHYIERIHSPTMKLTTILALSLSALPTILAAECYRAPSCSGRLAVSRNDLYVMRQHICGDTTLYKTAGSYTAHGACMYWPTWGQSNAQQVCWDAFENIINQCHPENTQINFKYDGYWELDAKRYTVQGCCGQGRGVERVGTIISQRKAKTEVCRLEMYVHTCDSIQSPYP